MNIIDFLVFYLCVINDNECFEIDLINGYILI